MLNQAYVTSLVASPIGIVLTGTPKVSVNYLLPSRIIDIHLLLFVIPNPIITGSPNTIIDNSPAARITDLVLLLPGPIITGSPNTFIN